MRIVLAIQKWTSDKVKQIFLILGILNASKLHYFHNSSFNRTLIFLWCHNECNFMTILYFWGTKKIWKALVMMFNFKVTFCISGVLYLQAQLLVPFLIASVFRMLSTLPKSVSQILAQSSATTASGLISAPIRGWNPGFKKRMGFWCLVEERPGYSPTFLFHGLQKDTNAI